ncbi:hypothetical protein C8R48DRAFT_678330 [Suillus tomentosus]|nr:hypothetical protein C8R48DRAFT_678330 [Suillus tomentosus]
MTGLQNEKVRISNIYLKAQDESKNVASSPKPIHDRLNELERRLENLTLSDEGFPAAMCFCQRQYAVRLSDKKCYQKTLEVGTRPHSIDIEADCILRFVNSRIKTSPKFVSMAYVATLHSLSRILIKVAVAGELFVTVSVHLTYLEREKERPKNLMGRTSIDFACSSNFEQLNSTSSSCSFSLAMESTLSISGPTPPASWLFILLSISFRRTLLRDWREILMKGIQVSKPHSKSSRIRFTFECLTQGLLHNGKSILAMTWPPVNLATSHPGRHKIKVGSRTGVAQAALSSSPALMTTNDTTPNIPSKRGSSALQMGPRKKCELLPAEQREHCVFKQLLDSYPGLLEQLKNGSKENILHIRELIGKGASGARGDDTKTLKSAVLDWISPKGEAIHPPLHRNAKIDQGFNHDLTGSLLCTAGLD